MSPELEDNLKSSHKLLFADLSDDDDLKHWGFRIGDGWFGIVSAALAALNRHAASSGKHLTLALCKEKFGELRLTVRGDNDEFVEAVEMVALELSRNTCEACGAPGKIGLHKHLIAVRCDRCAPGLT